MSGLVLLGDKPVHACKVHFDVAVIGFDKLELLIQFLLPILLDVFEGLVVEFAAPQVVQLVLFLLLL
jgi:hypothetical protein